MNIKIAAFQAQTTNLKNIFHSKLGGEIRQLGINRSAYAWRKEGVHGNAVMGSVEEVEEFAAQFQFFGFAEFESFIHRKIDICNSRGAETIATDKAVLSGTD